MSRVMAVLVYIFLMINMAGFIMVWIDKLKARKRLWRIPERVFFWFALIGGCPGIYSGFLLFRHKTRRWYFMVGIPFIFIVQLMFVYYVAVK